MSSVAYEVRGGKAVYGGRTLSEWVPEVVDAVVRAYDPEQVILFGSVARGDDGPDSDLDLMVVCSSIDYTKRHELEAQLYAASAAVPRYSSSSRTAVSTNAAATLSAPCTTGRSGKDGSSMRELPANNYEEARRWLQNVEDDLHAMHAVVRDPESPRRMVCFLSHLVVEKALKATLIDAGVLFQKTHNLLVLHDSCLERERLVDMERTLLAQCNPWAVDGRYADELASRLAGFAEQAVSEVRRELGADRGSL